MRQWSIPSKTTLAVVPIAVVALLTATFLVWNLVTSDTATGFSVNDTWAIVVGVVVGLVTIGSLIAVYLIAKSASVDIEEVSAAARRVANRDLLEVLDALRTPETDLTEIAPLDLDVDREDEVGDLARAFRELHDSLIEVAGRQMEALRAGVSSIFVTLARRNSSLVDRQLAMLDELESREEDSETLGGYYQLDHLATRMRRNAESLLVLAGSESPRVWAKATDLSDVVRAAVGEVDEYQRIEVVALEPARLSGGAVSDVAHLFAELLENAIQFSPPSESVRVTGLFDMDGYQLTVSDRGVGMSEARIAELNRILDKPPALGLSVEPTMGVFVVAKLAHRHGLRVELIRGVPGITARVTVPRDHLEIEEQLEPKFWESGHAERVLAARQGQDPSRHDVDETRQYVEVEEAGHAAALLSGAAGPDHVIDLTEDSLTIDATSSDSPHPRPGPAGTLPMRTPGKAFNDDDSPDPSTGPGDGAIGIKSALSAYERGRRAALENAEQGDDEEALTGEDES